MLQGLLSTSRASTSSSNAFLIPASAALPSPLDGQHPAGEVPLTPIAGDESALEIYICMEIGSDDEDIAGVESYAFAERVRDELFRRIEEAPEAARQAEAPRTPKPPAPPRPEEEERYKED